MNCKLTIHFLFTTLLLGVLLFGCKAGQDAVDSESKSNGGLSEKDKIRFEQTFVDANKEKILGNRNAALDLLDKSIAIDPSQAAPYYEKAQLLIESGQTTKAYEAIKKAVEIDDENFWYSFLKAKIAIELQEIETAQKIYQKLSKMKPNDLELRYELAGMYLYNGKYKEGIAELNSIEEEMGVTEEISLQKQKIYLKMGDVSKAAAEVRKLILENPGNMTYFNILADTYMVNGMEKEALEVYKEMESINPEDPKLSFALANFYRQKGEDEKAKAYVIKAFESEKMDIDSKIKVLLDYFVAAESNENTKNEALELCEILVKVHPNEAKSHAMYADYLYRDKQLDKASIQYKRTLELDSSRYAIWNQLIIVESERGDNKSLQQVSERALNLFPNQAVAYFFAGISSSQLKEYDKAINYLLTGKDYAVENKALKAQIYASLGDVYFEKKEKEKAYDSYEKSLKIEPSNVYVLNNYSYYLSLDKKQLEKAAEMAALANKIAPNQSSFEDTYGWVLFQQGKYEEAKEWIEKAYANGGSSSGVIVEHLGDVAAQLGNKEEAIEYWEKAKKIGDTSDQIDRKIKEGVYYE
ncbi:tetratricopeptide repeat protein [Acidiluteibacter ferrifornacis]|uniref:Tetratricopeptide repeat protein n=1 Tax=Acidiluteibacter ferrifornacis TaxID=2692424 RepID=A0A6N9NGW1_9FLAO|nr:tetratricopeptide repeat protein [Acidiluteibacter ferrifornacis]NBG65072.1 tetratricopeptide repeat protein [Acidiluteibacter ferrifornacis]